MIESKLIVAATLAAACIGAFAQASAPATPRADQREAVQQKRIDQATASGQLTTRETKRLDKQQARIGKVETQAKADGVVTTGERREVHRMQARANKNIHHQNNDPQVAPKP